MERLQRTGSHADLVVLFETLEQIVSYVFCWNTILLNCKMIPLCYLSLCQVEQFQVQLLLNADDRNLSTIWLIVHVIMCYFHFL